MIESLLHPDARKIQKVNLKCFPCPSGMQELRPGPLKNVRILKTFFPCS
uniref:Uncharacterized protein n=1 Tax=Anguilla anguilla TaxID=7936 RepID=A0A0E9R330_ANGAN